MTKEDFDAEVYEYAKSRINTEDSRMTDRMLAYRAGAEPREKRIAELEKENAKLKSECRTCVYTDSPCVRSDYPSKDGVCSHYKNVFDEIAELKKEVEKHKWNDIFLEDCAVYDKKIAEEYTTLQERIAKLEKENAELKNEWQEQVQKATDEGYARTLQTIQLSRAKEHIRTLISCLIDWVQEGDKDYCHIAEAEQFLSEVEK